MTNRQQTSSQTQLRKSLRRKDISLDKFLMRTKVPYSWGGNATSDIYCKAEKRAPGFKSEGLDCTNTVQFMFRTALIYKAANPQTLRKKLNISF